MDTHFASGHRQIFLVRIEVFAQDLSACDMDAGHTVLRRDDGEGYGKKFRTFLSFDGSTVFGDIE